MLPLAVSISSLHLVEFSVISPESIARLTFDMSGRRRPWARGSPLDGSDFTVFRFWYQHFESEAFMQAISVEGLLHREAGSSKPAVEYPASLISVAVGSAM